MNSIEVFASKNQVVVHFESRADTERNSDLILGRIGFQVFSAFANNRLPKLVVAQRPFGGQAVIPRRNSAFEFAFRFVALIVKWINRLCERIVKLRKTRQLLIEQNFDYLCI
jgi:hypothetical protein